MRKTKTVTIEAEGRDQGKVFKLTEMSASQSEDWAARVISGMARSGVDVPEDIAAGGMAGIAALGIRALVGMNFAEAKPLLAEMFECVQIVPDPTKPVTRALIESDIEEVATRLQLRKEVFNLHVDLFGLVDRLKSTLAATSQGDGSAT